MVLVEVFSLFSHRYRDIKLFQYSICVSKLLAIQHFNCSSTNTPSSVQTFALGVVEMTW